MKCPLCQKMLLEIGSTNPDYICQTRIKFEGKSSLAHYEQREGEGIHWYLPPYQIISKENETIVNMVNEDNKGLSASFYGKPNFKHIFTIQEKIHPDEPEKIMKRIKLLTLFS